MVPATGFLPAVAQICAQRGILLIADEVQAGIARTGDWFASNHEGLQPDLITMAKGLGGGLPIAALTGRAALLDAVPAGGLGGTFSGNPVSCEAALGVFDEIEHGDLLTRAVEVGRLMRAGLLDLQRRFDVIGDVRGRGAMMAIELVARNGDRTPDAALTGRIARRCHQQGVLVLTAGSWGNVLRFLPPLSIPDALLAEALQVLGAAIAAETDPVH